MYSNEEFISQILVEGELLTESDVELAKSQPLEGSVIQALISSGNVSEEQITQTIAANAAVDAIDLIRTEIPEEVLAKVEPEVARRYRVIPIADDGVYLTVAVADALDFELLDTLPHVLGREINLVCATPTAISTYLQQFYADEAAAESAADVFTVIGQDGEESVDPNDAPIIKLASNILIEAFNMGASDIHIEPMETSLRIRYRVDGKLIEAANHPKRLLPAVIARFKVMSSTMSIAEKRMPQDGRIQMRIAGKEVDLRVSSVPSNHGESLVMRILDKSALLLGLPQLGFLSDDQATFENLVTLPDGIILVTGPTGSGKTTTLYACLNYINRPDRKIITVEDPVEYEMPGINQVMVKADIGMTFSNALRAMLRQAPNVIMLGEIRDEETANIAIQASLTGHLVFSTLHTNDAPGTVARLADIGVKRFLIASAVRAIIAQRLVRKLCSECKAPVELNDQEMRMLNIDRARALDSHILGAQGCDRCRGSGYKGRIGIFEIFNVDDEVRHLINQDLTTPQLRKRARELGMRTMREDGIRKVLSGMTSAEEVISVTMSDGD